MNDLLGHLLTVLIGALAGALTPILIARFSKTPTERKGESKSLDAKTENEIAKAAESIAAGSTATITNLLRDIEYQRREVAEARKEIDTIVEARRLRDIETQKERDELKARIQSDLIETEGLRRQVVKLEDLAIKTGEYVDRILAEAKEKGWSIPLNGELWDSVRRLKLSVEERRRLAGGK
jgi:hypothetical protein